MKHHLFFTFVCVAVNCEWVEITPIENKKYLSGSKKLYLTTTEDYESIMKSPFLRIETTTTPTNLSNQETSTSSTTEATEKILTTEIPNLNTANGEFLNPSNDNTEYEQNTSASIEHFLPFLKTIQTNLLKFKKAHRSKMSVLKHLRDHLLFNIKDIVTRLWKPKISSEARTYQEDDGHMDFPSNEGALMTIGFLTFAVFLIKLVIKLIHALKSKQQYYEMTTTTTAASVVFLKRRKREEEQEQMNRILQYIEEF